MSEGSSLKRVIAEEVSEQVGFGDVLGDGSIEENIDGDEIGASVGREFGERIGRDLGEAIGRELHETIRTRLEKDQDPANLRTELVSSLRDAITETLESFEASDPVESMTKGVLEGSDEAEDSSTDDNGSEEPIDKIEDGPDADSLEGLRQETLEDFLSMLSYSDLQSIAKDVDVKANLSQETMIERIVETVSDSEDNPDEESEGEE